MDTLTFRGITIRPSELPPAVATAAAGRVPGGGDDVDPVEWIGALIDETLGTEHQQAVERALDMCLRTGDSRQLATMSEVATTHDVFDGAALLTTLRRPHVHRGRRTAVHVATAVANAIVSGRLDYDPELRASATDRRFRGALAPAFVHGDRAWFLDNARAVLGDDPEVATERLVTSTVTLDAEGRKALYDGLRSHVRDGSASWWEAVSTALGVADLELPDPTDTDRLPWKGEDGRWFEIPGQAEILMGSYVVRRGARSQGLDAEAVAPYEISEARARKLLARQVDSLYGAARESLQNMLSDLPTLGNVGARLPERLADVTGVETEELIDGRRPVKATTSPKELTDQLTKGVREALDTPEIRASLRDFAATLRAGLRELRTELIKQAEEDASED